MYEVVCRTGATRESRCLLEPCHYNSIAVCHNKGTTPETQNQKKKDYLIVLGLVRDLERAHGVDHSLHGREDVLVDQPGVAPFVLLRVARAVDDTHLLDECALPTLASP